MHMEGHYFKELKTVPVNFVVDTVLYYYCVYYEIYSLYDVVSVATCLNKNDGVKTA